MSKKLRNKRRFQCPDDLDDKENTLPVPSLKENTRKRVLTQGPTADLHTVATSDSAALGVLSTLAVASPLVFAPLFPTLPVEPSTVAEPTAPQTLEAHLLPSDGSRSRQTRWIKHTLASGLVIEVEPTRSNGLLPSLTEITDQPPVRRPIEPMVRTPSPQQPQSQSDGYTHIEDWLLSPRQGGDLSFEQYLENLRVQRELPFYQRTDWQRGFIPTLLKFLRTRSNPWDWSGDACVSILPDIWLTVYHEPSWPDEDGALVRSLAMDSVAAWLEAFASNALTAVETFLKSSTDGSPDFSKWSEICEGIMRDYRRSFTSPDGPNFSDLFRSMFVLTPLSAHLRTIRRGKWVEGLTDPSDELEFPFGAISLAAAAAFRAMLLFREQLVGIDEEGNIVVQPLADDDEGSRVVDTAFTKYTAGGEIRQYSSFACNLPYYRLEIILAEVYDLLHEEINSDDEI